MKEKTKREPMQKKKKKRLRRQRDKLPIRRAFAPHPLSVRSPSAERSLAEAAPQVAPGGPADRAPPLGTGLPGPGL